MGEEGEKGWRGFDHYVQWKKKGRIERNREGSRDRADMVLHLCCSRGKKRGEVPFTLSFVRCGRVEGGRSKNSGFFDEEGGGGRAGRELISLFRFAGKGGKGEPFNLRKNEGEFLGGGGAGASTFSGSPR